MVAVRHPELVRRVVTYSATFAARPDTPNPETTSWPQAKLRSLGYGRVRLIKTGYCRKEQTYSSDYPLRLGMVSGHSLASNERRESRIQSINLWP